MIFVAFEGGEGTGKSTQARLLADRLGPGTVLTREPGGTAIGAAIRSLVLDADTTGLAPRAEALLLAADRAQHVAEVIAPAVAAGRDVVTDRFSGSSLAYQGHGRGLGPDTVADLSAFATDGITPDLVVLLVVPPEVRAARIAARGAAADRIEREPDGFHERVEEGFRALAAAHPDHWVVIDGEGPVDDVAASVWAAVEAHRSA